LRLVGQASDSVLAEMSDAPFEDGAAWVKKELAGTRSTTSLAMLCLDVEGGVCSWLSSPSANPAVVAALARQGGSAESGARSGGSALEFYAGDAFSSSVQALDAREGNGAGVSIRKRTERRKLNAGNTQRLAVLAIEDVPARLLMDAMDRQGVPVESVASLWHIMSAAWDPGTPRPGTGESDAIVAESAALTAVLVVDPASGRLLWSWSRAGRLVVAGSMRVRHGVVAPDAIVEEGAALPPAVLYGPEEVSRLATEWLSWAVQVGQAPSRFVCILPDAEQAGEFGRAVGTAWAGATVDVVTKDDPVGATLHRITNLLENTPLKDEPDPRAGLVDLSRRPGRQHRRMYTWWSGAIAAGALVLTVLGWQLGRTAKDSDAAAKAWTEQGRAAIKEVFPEALVPRPGESPYKRFKDELDKQERAAKPLDHADAAMPVLEELETISLVLGNSGYAIESVDLDSKGLPRVTTVTASTRDAEDLLDALKRVSNSHVVDWTFTPSNKQEGEVTKVRATYTGRWASPANKGGKP
jgi:hypothetical protein